MTEEPTKSSGNGNPAFWVLIFYIPFAIWFGSTWITCLDKLFLKFKIKTALSVLSFSFLILGAYITVVRYNKFYNVFSSFAMQYYKEYNINFIKAATTGITIYTNAIYFNFITFLMYVAILNIISAIILSKKFEEFMSFFVDG